MLHSRNPGHILPFFSTTAKQSFRQLSAAGEQLTGLISDNQDLIPFQVRFNSAAGNPTWAVIDALTNVRTDLPSNLLSKTTIGSFDYCTYNGGDIGTTLECGKYYYINLFCSGQDVFSEVFRVELDGGTIFNNQYQVTQIEFTNSKNIDQIYYENGYKQKVILKGYFDRGFSERAESVISDGFGNEVVQESRTIENMRFEAYPIHEQQIIAFQSIRDCDDIKIRNLATNEVVDTKSFRFEFEPVGNSFYKGIFTFQVYSLLFQKC